MLDVATLPLTALEWRSGRSGHLPLQDEDVTTEMVKGWKRVNTLAHYHIPDGATMALIPKRFKNDFVRQVHGLYFLIFFYSTFSMQNFLKEKVIDEIIDRACYSGGQYWDCCPVTLSLNQVTATNLMIVHL